MRSSWKPNFSLLKSEFRILYNNQIEKRILASRAKVRLRKKIKDIFVNKFDKINLTFLGKKVKVHTGKKLIELKIIKNMILHKFGEFIFTKKRGILIHQSKKNKKKLLKIASKSKKSKKK